MGRYTLTAGDSKFSIEVGTEESRAGAHLSIYAGGSNGYSSPPIPFEGDKGYIIVEALPVVTSAWGEQGYFTSLTGRDANFEKIEKINAQFEESLTKASANEDKETSEQLQQMRKTFLDYYYKFASANSHFEVVGRVQSHEKKVLGVVVDTKTANLEMHFIFKVTKLITPEEAALIHDFISTALANKQKITMNLEIPASVQATIQKYEQKQLGRVPPING